MNATSFLEEVRSWATTRSDILGVALVGSHAKGTARSDSDVDLVVLCSVPAQLIDGRWASHFGEHESMTVEDYGALKSLRIFYRGGLEVEFGLADATWARTPLDPGTRSVLVGGARVLYDPRHLFQAAVDATVA